MEQRERGEPVELPSRAQRQLPGSSNNLNRPTTTTHLFSSSKPKVPIDLTDIHPEETQQFLRAITGKEIDPELSRELTLNGFFYAHHAVSSLLQSSWFSNLTQTATSTRSGPPTNAPTTGSLAHDTSGSAPSVMTTLKLLALCTSAVREDHNRSALDLIHLAVQDGLLNKECQTTLANQAINAMYHLLGRITMFFEVRPLREPISESLTVYSGDTRYPPVPIPHDELHERPMFEVLFRFEDILPHAPAGPFPPSVPSPYLGVSCGANTLAVSCVCASTLCKFGGFNIVWTQSLGSHLCFDPFKLELYLFCFPSFCDVSRFERGLFAKVLDYYFDDGMSRTRPPCFTPAKYFQELQTSYKVIFADEKRSRSIWRKAERAKAAEASGGTIDPWLELLAAGGGKSKQEKRAIRTTYSFDSDFPVFSHRLRALQDHIQSQQSNRWSVLWHDRRDLLKWSQFWLILIVSAVGLFLSGVQTVFTVTQTAYAIKADHSGG